jgi:hypothetical protein
MSPPEKQKKLLNLIFKPRVFFFFIWTDSNTVSDGQETNKNEIFCQGKKVAGRNRYVTGWDVGLRE